MAAHRRRGCRRELDHPQRVGCGGGRLGELGLAFSDLRRKEDGGTVLKTSSSKEGEKDLQDARQDYATVLSAYSDYGSRLRSWGIDAAELRATSPGTIWTIAEVPESQIGSVRVNEKVNVEFNSYAVSYTHLTLPTILRV